MTDERYANGVQEYLDVITSLESQTRDAYDRYVRICDSILYELVQGNDERQRRALARQEQIAYRQFLSLFESENDNLRRAAALLRQWRPTDRGYARFHDLASRNFSDCAILATERFTAVSELHAVSAEDT